MSHGVIMRPVDRSTSRRNPWLRRRRAASAAAGDTGSVMGASTGRPAALSPSYARELASRRRTEYGWWEGEEPHPSGILSEHSDSTHRLGELYRVMRRDDTALGGLLEKRVKSLLGLPRVIEAEDSSDRAILTANFCHQALRGVPKFHINLRNQITGILDGVAFDETVYKKAIVLGRNAWVPRDIFDRPMWRFGFVDGRLHVRTAAGGLEPVPPARFLVNTCGSKDTRWGEALMDSVYWHWWLKLKGWKYYAVAVEKWAQPNVIGRYPRTTGKGDDVQAANAERQAEVLSIVDDILAETGVSIPADVIIDLLESKGSSSATYEQFIAMCDRAMALAILGEVDTSGMGKGPGSYAKSRVSNEVRLETLMSDAHELATHLTDNLLAPLVWFNFGADWPVPRWTFDIDEAANRAERRNGLTTFLELPPGEDEDGEPLLKVSVAHVHRVCQVPMPKEGEATISAKSAPAPPKPTEPAPPVDEDADQDEEESDDE